ncbi:unnamed protein product [Lymnaea stagnalis]|uniref:Uncharacterized protein n=1 Tax=Lymnaea stagnalis TaxID=6523 RepID=A0AAV2HVY3_LYMST
METINDICTPRADKFFSVDCDEDLVKSPLKESTNNIQSALVASLRAGSLSENIKLRTASKTPHRLVLPNEMKPLQTPVSAKSHRPQIKRLRTFHSPRKVNHRSPKLKSPHHLRSPGKFSGPS